MTVLCLRYAQTYMFCLQLTLARNKPILFKDLDLKTILYDAYEQGKMIAVLPFINKVCAISDKRRGA